MSTGTLPPIRLARIQVAEAIEHLDRVFSSTCQPGMLQKAARDLTAACDHLANLKRESPRGTE